ncbi:TonB-dependent receptor [Rhodobacteraceae bacterium]|nr:TonB-dependent receptor [Paracoccaceae bacterium]
MSCFFRPRLSIPLGSVCFAALVAPAFAQGEGVLAFVPLDPIVVSQEAADAGADHLDGADIFVKSGGDLDRALRDTPGAFTRQASDNPGITVNIRGMQSAGRVNSMIDGVPQTFRNVSGHAGTSDTLVYVDPGLLAGVDITRGAVSGAQGLGTLGGAADFRTLEAGDVLRDGRSTGGLYRFYAGTNGRDWGSTLAGAMRGAGFEGVAAISGYGQDHFEDGHGVKTTSGDAASPRSYLLKGAFDLGAAGRLQVSGMDYRADFDAAGSSGYAWEVENKTASILHRWTPNRLVDLSTQIYWNETTIDMPRDTSGSDTQDGAFVGRSGVNTGHGMNMTNRSALSVVGVPVVLSYGFAWSSDEYEGKRKAGSNADGRLIKSGGFVDGAFDFGRIGLEAGLRYDHYALSGATEYSDTGAVQQTASRSDGQWNPHVKLSYALHPEATIFASYARTMRPPTAQEMFYPSSSHITWARIAEPNLDLQAERADTFELGGTWRGHDMLSAGDMVSLNATLFRSDIDNYITYGTFGGPTDGVTWLNTDGTTRMQGLELEARYDTDTWYGGLSLTLADTDKPLSVYGGATASTAELPDDYATLDVGRRWMGGAITTGAKVRYIGTSTTYPMIYSMGTTTVGEKIKIDDTVLLDLYATWQVNPQFDLYANIENVADTYYLDANASFNEAENGLGGRGRTLAVGGTIRF